MWQRRVFKRVIQEDSFGYFLGNLKKFCSNITIASLGAIDCNIAIRILNTQSSLDFEM